MEPIAGWLSAAGGKSGGYRFPVLPGGREQFGDRRVDFFAAEAAPEDGAVRAEEDQVRDGVHPVELDGKPFPVQDLRPGHIQIPQCLQGVLPLVVHGNAHHLETLTVESPTYEMIPG